jgi:hypothetical protein
MALYFQKSRKTPIRIHIQSHPVIPVTEFQDSMYMIVVLGKKMIPRIGSTQSPLYTASHLSLKNAARTRTTRGAKAAAKASKHPKIIILSLLLR